MIARISADGVGTASRFNRPGPLAIDQRGNLYVGDTRDSSLRVGKPLRTALERANPFAQPAPILDWIKASEREIDPSPLPRDLQPGRPGGDR